MAVVKSPKNIKRKNRWIKSLQNKIKFKIIKRNYIPNHAKRTFNLYRKLAFRRKKNLLIRNTIFLLKT